MKPEKIVQNLVEAARRLGFKVRIEEGNFRGGQCVVAEERMLIINRRANAEERADLLAKILIKENIEELFLLPEVRKYLEKFSKTEESAETPEKTSEEAPPSQ